MADIVTLALEERLLLLKSLLQLPQLGLEAGHIPQILLRCLEKHRVAAGSVGVPDVPDLKAIPCGQRAFPHNGGAGPVDLLDTGQLRHLPLKDGQIGPVGASPQDQPAGNAVHLDLVWIQAHCVLSSLNCCAAMRPGISP